MTRTDTWMVAMQKQVRVPCRPGAAFDVPAFPKSTLSDLPLRWPSCSSKCLVAWCHNEQHGFMVSEHVGVHAFGPTQVERQLFCEVQHFRFLRIWIQASCLQNVHSIFSWPFPGLPWNANNRNLPLFTWGLDKWKYSCFMSDASEMAMNLVSPFPTRLE